MRVCRLCGENIEDRRCDARFCSDGCRREAYRIVAILTAEDPPQYASVRRRQEASSNRANGATGALLRREGLA